MLRGFPVLLVTAAMCAYFLSFAGVCLLWLSCFDFAPAARSACAALFCFWLRSFDLGDLSPMRASVPTMAVVPSRGKWRRPRPGSPA